MDKRVIRVGVVVFGLNLVVSSLASLVTPGAALNDGWFGISLPFGVLALGLAGYLFLFKRVDVGGWVWAVLVGSFGANLFERVIFGSVYDWIPIGVGLTNTADIGILVALTAILVKAVKK